MRWTMTPCASRLWAPCSSAATMKVGQEKGDLLPSLGGKNEASTLAPTPGAALRPSSVPWGPAQAHQRLAWGLGQAHTPPLLMAPVRACPSRPDCSHDVHQRGLGAGPPSGQVPRVRPRPVRRLHARQVAPLWPPQHRTRCNWLEIACVLAAEGPPKGLGVFLRTPVVCLGRLFCHCRHGWVQVAGGRGARNGPARHQ